MSQKKAKAGNENLETGNSSMKIKVFLMKKIQYSAIEKEKEDD
jgi:hypothetical protein